MEAAILKGQRVHKAELTAYFRALGTKDSQLDGFQDFPLKNLNNSINIMYVRTFSQTFSYKDTSLTRTSSCRNWASKQQA